MIKISDKGISEFEEEYQQIILRKLKYGNAYNRNILLIMHKEIKEKIEKNIEICLGSERKLKKLKTDVIHELLKITNVKKEYIEIYLCLSRGEKNFDRIRDILKSKYNIFLSEHLVVKFDNKDDRIEFIKNKYPVFYSVAEEYKCIINIFSNKKKIKDNKKKFEENSKIIKELLNGMTVDELIVARNEDLKNIIYQIRNLKKANEIENLQKISNFFDYKKYIDSDLRNIVLNKIGVTICPYCGRQFITNYYDKEHVRNSADLDHFYAKKKYPILSLSLYNFIPSCSICNTRHKKEKDFYIEEHLYPYVEGFEQNAKFDIDHTTLITDIISGKEKAKILIYAKENPKIENNIKTFRLESLYQNHSKEVQNIFNMIQIYRKSYLEDLANVLYINKNFNDIKNKISDINEIKTEKIQLLKDEFEKFSEVGMAMRTEELMLLLFKEKGNDEILSKLYNDLLDKYWRMK